MIDSSRATIEAGLTSAREKAVFLAASFPHSGAWLNALPIANCGLRIDGEAVRVGVALRLGLELCAPHDCGCGAQVDAWGDHAFSCKNGPGKAIRHHAINDIIARALTSAKIPVCKEPHGLVPGTNLRLDGSSLLPWSGVKYLAGTPRSPLLWLNFTSSSQVGSASTAARKVIIPWPAGTCSSRCL